MAQESLEGESNAKKEEEITTEKEKHVAAKEGLEEVDLGNDP